MSPKMILEDYIDLYHCFIGDKFIEHDCQDCDAPLLILDKDTIRFYPFEKDFYLEFVIRDDKLSLYISSVDGMMNLGNIKNEIGNYLNSRIISFKEISLAEFLDTFAALTLRLNKIWEEFINIKLEPFPKR